MATVIDLSMLGNQGFFVQGDETGDRAGQSVSGTGDINGDGIDDFIIGASMGKSGGLTSGEAYVIFGKAYADRANIDLTTLSPADGFIIKGDSHFDEAGDWVSGAGDINGDGIQDLIVTAPRGDNGGGNTGEAYVIFGRRGATRNSIYLTSLGAADGFIIQGDSSGDLAGYGASGVGDINGDGIDDLVIGAPRGDDGGTDAGEAYVIFGKAGATRANIDLTSLAASDGFIIQGGNAGDTAGYSVSGGGDVNGDGIDDLIVGAPGGDGGGVNSGKAYVIFGKAGATRTTIDLTSLAATDGFVIQGDSFGDNAGTSVSVAGDINADGIDDLVVGAPSGDLGGNAAGQAYVIFGKAGATRANIDLSALAAADGFVIQGDNAGDGAGFSVSRAGDVNGDGIDDLIIGANDGDDGGSNAGEAYVIFGRAGATRANLDLSSLAPADGVIIQGDAAGHSAGYSVSGAGDINGDGYDDMLVGAVFAPGPATGGAYVVYGRANFSGANTAPVAGDDVLQMDADTSRTFSRAQILGNDIDAEGNFTLSIASTSNITNGSVEVHADGSLTFTPTPGFTGIASFDYVANDGALSDTGHVEIAVFEPAPAKVIDLSDLGDLGFTIQGDAAGDAAGYSVSSAGDVNGDGIDDFIVGAHLGNNGGSDAGEAYVIFGKVGATRPNIDLTSLAAADGFIIQGDTGGDNAGFSVSGVGDLNGDGVGDLVVGAPNGDNGGFNAGEAYVIFGKVGATRTNIDLTSLAAADGFVIQGDTFLDNAGLNVSGAGDINGDGFDDLIIGTPRGDNGGIDAGEAYVIFGKAGATRTNIDLTSLAASDGFILQGDSALDNAGWSVSGAGDINGDGYDDFLVGAPIDGSGGIASGTVYAIFGKAGSTRANIDLTSLSTADGFIIQGDSTLDNAGWSVSGAGDINGDGIDDFVVGTPRGDDGGIDAGEAYVIFGKAGATRTNIDLTSLAATDGFIIQGDAALDNAGWSVSGAGDFNGDGIDDLIIGAPRGDDGGIDAGEAYVIFGRAGATRTNIDLTSLSAADGFIVQGDSTLDNAGLSVSAAGDVNADGYDDILVGAPIDSAGGLAAGAAYVIFGRASLCPPELANEIAHQFSPEDAQWTFRVPADIFRDPDLDPLTLVATLADDQPLPGWLSFDADSWTFSGTPPLNFNGVIDLKVTASDRSGAEISDTFSLTITPVNDATRARPDAYGLDEDSMLVVPAPGVLDNDYDVEGDTLTATLASGPAHGVLVLNANGSFTYTPDADYNGPDSFTYRVSDGTVTSAPVTVSLTVDPVNDAPVAVDDALSGVRNTPLQIAPVQLLVNDSDVDEDHLSITNVLNPSHGTVSIQDGNIVFVPDANFTGTAGFDYLVDDGLGGVDTGHVRVNIGAGTNRAPTVTPAGRQLATLEDTAITFKVIASDSDGDTLGFLASTPAHGTVSKSTAGQFTYTPAAGYLGEDSFTVTVSDGRGGIAQQQVAIDVVAPVTFGASGGADWSLFARGGFAGEIGGNGVVFGTSGFEDISVLGNPGMVAFDPSFARGGDIVRLPGNAASWFAAVSGGGAVFSDGETLVSVPLGSNGLAIVFADGVRELVLDQVPMLGSQTLDATLTPVAAPADGTALPTGANPDAVARLFLFSDGEATVGGRIDAFGTNGEQRLAITHGDVRLDPSFARGGDTIVLDDAAPAVTARTLDASVLLDGIESLVRIPVGTNGLTLDFADADHALLIVPATNSVYIGDQLITATAAALSFA